MNRRTFLKGLFAAAVTPASVVKVLYRPNRWAGYTYGYTGITPELIKEIRAAHRNTIYQPPKRINFVYEGPVNFICEKRRANMVITPKGD